MKDKVKEQEIKAAIKDREKLTQGNKIVKK